MFQRQVHLYRRAVVRQEVSDVRRSHRLDVNRIACESQAEHIYKTNARSSVEELSIKSIFNVHPHFPCLFASDNVEGEQKAI